MAPPFGIQHLDVRILSPVLTKMELVPRNRVYGAKTKTCSLNFGTEQVMKALGPSGNSGG